MAIDPTAPPIPTPVLEPTAPAGSIVRFPSDLQNIKQDTEYIRIKSCTYKKGDVVEDSTFGTIMLFMPAGLSFTNGQKWNAANWTPLGAQMRNNLAGLMEDDVLDHLQDEAWRKSTIDKTVSSFKAAIGPYGRAYAANYVSGALNVFGSAVGVNVGANPAAVTSSMRGQVLNNQSELYFEGINLRQWGLNYVFTPKNRKDEAAMQQIIQRLKVASTPKKNDDNAWLEIPKVFKVEFCKGGGVNESMPLTKPAALTNIDVSYNPGMDFWASHDTGSPVSIGVAMSFAEIELIYSDDHYKGNLGY